VRDAAHGRFGGPEAIGDRLSWSGSNGKCNYNYNYTYNYNCNYNYNSNGNCLMRI
jgi:hypothetical protein